MLCWQQVPRAVGRALFEGAGAEDEADGAGPGEALVARGEEVLEVEAGDDLVALAEAVELGARLLRAGGDDHDAVVDGRALAVGGGDDAREVADEAVEVFELRVEVDLDVGVVDDPLLEGG